MAAAANRRRQTMNEDSKLTKEEEKYAKFLRFNCPTKVGLLNSNEYSFFAGSKAVEVLLESKYGPNGKEPHFMTKGDCEVFIRNLIIKGAVFRAKKVVMVKKSAEERKKKDKTSPTNTPKTKRDKDEKKKPKIEKEAKEASDSETDANKNDADGDEKKEKKKKFYLVLQQNQSFTTETSDVYTWVYDPVSLKNKIIGILICFGVVAGCLFPLWPDWLRIGVYYLSLAGIFLLLLLMGTALARTVLFGIIYGLSFGKHRLWVLPNLTADCGFFESFQPFYTYEFVAGDAENKKKKKLKKPTDGDKESLVKDESENEQDEEEEETKKDDEQIDDDEEEKNEDEEEENASEEQSSEGSSEPIVQAFETVPADDFEPELTGRRRRRAARKDDNDFVIVDK